eukprot:scaffold133363_cov26-Tisochrysis_lutea.AAC.2
MPRHAHRRSRRLSPNVYLVSWLAKSSGRALPAGTMSANFPCSTTTSGTRAAARPRPTSTPTTATASASPPAPSSARAPRA